MFNCCSLTLDHLIGPDADESDRDPSEEDTPPDLPAGAVDEQTQRLAASCFL